MKKHLLYCLDYHHGQATRVVAGGMPYLKGDTMAARQDYLEDCLGSLVRSLCREPRGHRQMLGAIITPPASQEAEAGLIFTHPSGYFGMCGDSLFSGVTALVETGMLVLEGPSPHRFLIDTVQGSLPVEVTLDDVGELVGVTMENVASYTVGQAMLEVGEGTVQVEIAFGGLYYGFVSSEEMGVDLLSESVSSILEAGSLLFREARENLEFLDPRSEGVRGLDLVTLHQETHPGVFRVANFYGEGTMGRTPSGTGLSARVALEMGKGRLGEGGVIYHESPLGMRFSGEAAVRKGQIHPRITARSYLMGVNLVTVLPEDPFGEGFIL